MRFSYPPLCVQVQWSVVILPSLWLHCENVGMSLHVNREKQPRDNLSDDNEAFFRQIKLGFLGGIYDLGVPHTV